MRKKIILGTGVAGLTAGYFNKDSTIIGKELMGQMNGDFSLGPRLLQFDSNLLDICIELFGPNNVVIKNIKIGYIIDSAICDTLNQDFKLKYSEITRNTKKIKSSFLSGGKNQIAVIIINNNFDNSYTILLQKIIDILNDRKQIIIDDVDKILLNKDTVVTDCEEYKYDTLYNTIPLNIFNKLTEPYSIFQKDIFELGCKYFYKTNFDNVQDIESSKEFKYLYSVDGLWTRKTYFSDDNYIVYETINKYSQKEIDGNRIIEQKTIPIQIMKNINFKEYDNIFFIGRYAQWTHKIKINEIIKRILELKNE